MQMTRLYEAAKFLRGIEGQSEVARVLNASPQTVNNWEARGMSKTGMLKAQAEIGVSATWLETGQGPMELRHLLGVPLASVEGSYREVEAFNAGNPAVVPVPKVNIRVRAGVTGFEVDSDSEHLDTYPIERSWIEANGFSQSRLIAMRVKGDSMEPRLYNGDIIVVNTGDTKPVDGDPYVINFEGEVVVKRLTRDAGEWWLTSDNPEPRYHRRIVRTNETIIVGKVVKRDTTRI